MNAHPAGPRHAEELHHFGVPPCPSSTQELLELAPNVWPRNAVRGDDDRVVGSNHERQAREIGRPAQVGASACPVPGGRMDGKALDKALEEALVKALEPAGSEPHEEPWVG